MDKYINIINEGFNKKYLREEDINISSYFFSKIELIDGIYKFTVKVDSIKYEDLIFIFDKNQPNMNYEYRLFFNTFKDSINMGRYSIYIRNENVRNPDKTNPTYSYIGFRFYERKDNNALSGIMETQYGGSISDYIKDSKNFEEKALNKLAEYLKDK